MSARLLATAALVTMLVPAGAQVPVQDRQPAGSALRPAVMGSTGGVSTGHPLTTAAAFGILLKGGNAFDAGVASLLAGGVLEQDQTADAGADVAPHGGSRARCERKSRVVGIVAARDRFYKGDIAKEMVAFLQKHDAPFDLSDFSEYFARIEEPAKTTYRAYAVYKHGFWQPGARAAVGAEHPRAS